jgi:dihydroorotase
VSERASEASLILDDVRIVDPSRGLDAPGHLVVRDGAITHCAAGPAPSVEGLPERTAAAGLAVAPGFWDLHVHLREPGQEDRETIATGCAAAATGGFTDVVSMPNTQPAVDTAAAVHMIRNKAEEAGLCRVHPAAALTMGLGGTTMCEYGDLVQAGAVALTDDGRPVCDAGLLRRAMEYSTILGVPVITHAEDLSLSHLGVMHEGKWSTRLGLRGIPYAAEVVAIARDIELARLTGAHLHVAHVSCKPAVDLIRRAKDEGLRVTAETAPHFLDFTDADCASFDTRFKVNPPLRTMVDQEALIEGLVDGTLDCIATDHAPHTVTEKEQPFGQAPFGIIGLETSFASCHDRLVRRGPVSLLRLIELMSAAPARILGRRGGSLAPGDPADFTLIDTSQTWMPREGDLRSKGRNCPWLGRSVTGRVVATYRAGRPLVQVRRSGGSAASSSRRRAQRVEHGA